jgi:hypothetical protein
VEASNDCPEHEANEVFVVFKPDTVAGPRAVVIHSHHTLLTDTTMMGSRRLEIITFFAKPVSNERFGLFINFYDMRLVLIICVLFLVPQKLLSWPILNISL